MTINNKNLDELLAIFDVYVSDVDLQSLADVVCLQR